jgi:hypothetical protein
MGVRHEARPDQTVRQQFSQPHRIVDVGLAARHILARAALRVSTFSRVQALCLKLPLRLPCGPPDPLAPPAFGTVPDQLLLTAYKGDRLAGNHHALSHATTARLKAAHDKGRLLAMAEAWLDLADRAHRLARHHVGRLKEYPLLSSKLGNEPQEAE